jgi:hypothetical protein
MLTFVLTLFSHLGYRPAMTDDPSKLTPAKPRDVETCIALALTSGRAYQRSQAAEVTAQVVAERLVGQLEASGFVIMRRPDPPLRSFQHYPPDWPHTKPDDRK